MFLPGEVVVLHQAVAQHLRLLGITLLHFQGACFFGHGQRGGVQRIGLQAGADGEGHQLLLVAFACRGGAILQARGTVGELQGSLLQGCTGLHGPLGLHREQLRIQLGVERFWFQDHVLRAQEVLVTVHRQPRVARQGGHGAVGEFFGLLACTFGITRRWRGRGHDTGTHGGAGHRLTFAGIAVRCVVRGGVDGCAFTNGGAFFGGVLHTLSAYNFHSRRLLHYGRAFTGGLTFFGGVLHTLSAHHFHCWCLVHHGGAFSGGGLRSGVHSGAFHLTILGQ